MESRTSSDEVPDQLILGRNEVENGFQMVDVPDFREKKE